MSTYKIIKISEHCGRYWISILSVYNIKQFNVITQTDDSRGSKAFSSVCDSVYLSVCPHKNSKTNDHKVFKLSIENDLGIAYKWYDLGSRGQRSRSQSAKKQSSRRRDQLYTASSAQPLASSFHILCLCALLYYCVSLCVQCDVSFQPTKDAAYCARQAFEWTHRTQPLLR